MANSVLPDPLEPQNQRKTYGPPQRGFIFVSQQTEAYDGNSLSAA